MSDTRNTDRQDTQRGRSDAKSIPSTRDDVDPITVTGGMRGRYQPHRQAAHGSRRTDERQVTTAARRDPDIDVGRLDAHDRRTLGRRIS